MSGAALAVTLPHDPVLVKLERARLALSEAKSLQGVKQIADLAAAGKVYARQQKLGQESIDFAHAVQVEAMRRLGEILREAPKAAGTKGRGRPFLGGARREPPNSRTQPPTLKEIGLTKKESSIAQTLADLPAAQFDQVRANTISITAAMREVVHAKRPSVPLPDRGTYRVLYADPPWSYGNSGIINPNADNYGRAARHYPSMTIDALRALQVKALTDADAVLFLWVTSPLLAESFAVIAAWGFHYKTSFVWDKVRHNFGHYNSVRHEFLLVCTRGACTPDVRTLHDSVQSIERSPEHSAKPEAFRSIIDELYPRGRRLELFARRPAPEPWETWGNE